VIPVKELKKYSKLELKKKIEIVQNQEKKLLLKKQELAKKIKKLK
jgi:hypothetical protein